MSRCSSAPSYCTCVPFSYISVITFLKVAVLVNAEDVAVHVALCLMMSFIKVVCWGHGLVPLISRDPNVYASEHCLPYLGPAAANWSRAPPAVSAAHGHAATLLATMRAADVSARRHIAVAIDSNIDTRIEVFRSRTSRWPASTVPAGLFGSS